MKAILTFNLPDEQEEFRQASQAGEAFRALEEFGEYLRSQEKYVDPDKRDSLLEIRQTWFGIMRDLLE